MKPTNKPFDAVEFMRQQRDLPSAKLSKMTKEEVIACFKNRALHSHVKPCA
jgi:hypothetical protein